MRDGSRLSELYRIRFPDAEDLARRKEIWRVLCDCWFARFVQPTDTVVDVACGYGEFINQIAAARRIAIDLNEDTRENLASSVEFHQLSATELPRIGTGIADVVFTSNFLEHLPDKATLEVFLGQVRTILKPGGRYMILGPNLRYLPGEYWDFYDHHLGLTHLSLSEALMLQGFKIHTCIDRFLPYTTRSKLPTHPGIVRLYLRLRFAWPWFGKQFFIVATAPA